MSPTPANRPPLPQRALPDEIVGHDTRLQAAENCRRADSYIAMLARNGLPLPAAPQKPQVLGIAEVGREAGLSLGVLRPGHSIRKLIEAAIPQLGLAIIVSGPDSPEAWSIAECHARFLALAPAKAAQAGLRPETMESAVARVFDIIMYRNTSNTDAPALPIIRKLQADDAEGVLELDDNCIRIIRTFEDWAAQCNTPSEALSASELSEMAFHDLLLHGMDRTGLSQGQVAEIMGISQGTVWKWLREGRAPNVRSHAALRSLALHFGFSEDTLVRAIRRKRLGDDRQLNLTDFPIEFREARFKTVRAAVKSQLAEEDFQVSTAAFEARIADLCAAVEKDFTIHRKRKAMRDENYVDRTAFPSRLTYEISEYRAHLCGKGRAQNTQNSYVSHIEGFFGFALSSKSPDRLRLDPAEAALCAVASRPLWEAYFLHLSKTGKRQMGPSFQVNRSLVERMKAVTAMFGSADVFLSNTDFSVGLQKLEADHLPWATKNLSIPQLCARIAIDLKEFRQSWLKRSQKPTAGRDEISDLLSLKDPLLAVRRMIDHLRLQIKSIQKYEPGVNEKSERVIHRHYATAYRKLIVIHLLGQTALRVGMLPEITVGRNVEDHLRFNDGPEPRLVIPAELFKNGGSEVFKDGPYKRNLKDIYGFYRDLNEYLTVSRPRLLAGAQTNRLFLSWSIEKGAGPINSHVVRAELTEISRAALGPDAPKDQRLIAARHLRPHHFRDILATAVLHRTNRNYALAADAIHVSEETARTYYAHDSVEMRRPDLEAVFTDMANPDNDSISDVAKI